MTTHFLFLTFSDASLDMCAVSRNLRVSQSVSQSDTHSLCGRSDCPPLRTILCQRKCIGHAMSEDVIKSGGSTCRSSTWEPPERIRGDIRLWTHSRQ